MTMKVNVVSLLDPSRHGGLEAYVRLLLMELPKKGVHIALNGSVNHGGADLAEIWHGRSRRLLPLMTRRPLRHFARWFSNQVGRRWADSIVDGFDVHHLVGTSWDLLGFPLSRAAKKNEKLLTCFPAIHPGTWGDAALDIDLYQRCDAIFCQSHSEVKHLQSSGVSMSGMVCVNCGPEFKPIGPAEQRDASKRLRSDLDLGDRPIVLFVGRKSRGKGYHQLMEAVQALAGEGSDLVLLAIGRDVDPPFPTIPAHNFRDLGTASDKVKKAAFAACDLFVLPSEAESFGIVYVEAWSYSKPVICGTAPASRELVTTHQGGLVSDGTVRDIAAKIKMLLDDEGLRLKMGSSGHEAYQKYFTPDSVASRHIGVWQGLLGERRHPPRGG
jgi:glycosyltransferase involved in cell wall biosynthesis